MAMSARPVKAREGPNPEIRDEESQIGDERLNRKLLGCSEDRTLRRMDVDTDLQAEIEGQGGGCRGAVAKAGIGSPFRRPKVACDDSHASAKEGVKGEGVSEGP